MKLAVFGPRDIIRAVDGELVKEVYTDYNHVCRCLETYPKAVELITGGGAGVEQLALRYAAEEQIAPKVCPPRLHLYAGNHEMAFARRNDEILAMLPDVVVIIWDGKGKHYPELIGKSAARGLLTHVYPMV